VSWKPAAVLMCLVVLVEGIGFEVYAAVGVDGFDLELLEGSA
jgi:hypothetical protein